MAVSRRLPALLLAVTLGACAAQGQVRQQDMAVTFSDGRFQVTWETAQTKKGSPLIAGYVQNTRGNGAANIRLQVETLDAQGQVIATATALAPGYLGSFSRTSFEVPLEKTGVGYRVSIIGWDPAGNGQ
ncbi:MAG TPA: FxLYD domain-containing protein [Methylomirabilota bacterium]|nr:FxLYD domain-containing protein [Methylomirabilota bacterium]